ncbi:catalase-like domain-containing protein [Suillus discolor]|uniref:Catalase n=1 Tax=Suillus discolor TaxID=1912936 RepID=A0A9P7EZI1_9AGAM|nr:catalase-like domain-containing protein [Suillus discolor]KAG2097734.1 catalase-like domain-containing protein [Suillus discolor]
MPSPQVFAATDGAVYTTSNGAPVAHPLAAERVGPVGPLLLQDFHHIDLLAHFDRERIPERVVHAKGAGAHGYFETTHDLSDITSCKLFTDVGKQVKITVRFSTVGGESGSADTARDPRGFSLKLKTEEGNLDWVFNNTPVFFIRDPAKFPPFIHTQKRDPQTHLKDPDMFWDYLSQNPESAHQVMILFSDRGIPDGYHNMHAYSGHTFKLVKDDGSWVYTQIHCIADGGFKVLDTATARNLSADNPDYGIQSLFETIDAGKFPSWTVYVQTMTPEQAENFRYNVLDLTKIWPHKDYPLRPVGKFVLNENPQNYFAEIEQAAFAPSHLIPYFEATADPVLQSRLFSYPDTHRHRLGANYHQLPVNAPIVHVAHFQRDGPMAFNSQGARPNYQSSITPLTYVSNKGSKNGTPRDYERAKQHESWVGGAFWDLSEITELDFEQPRALYQNVMDDGARARLVSNIAGHLGGAKSAEVRARTLSYFASVDQSLSDRIAKAIGSPTAKPLAVKPASEAVRFRHGVGAAA